MAGKSAELIPITGARAADVFPFSKKARIKNPGEPGELLRVVPLFVPVLYRYSHQDRLLE